MAARKDIYKYAKGFDKNPQNINRKGQPPSLKKQLLKLLEFEGKMTVKWSQVIDVREGIEITIKIPTEILLMQKLMSHAMSTGNTSMKAIELMMSYIDGKPNQSVDLNHSGEIKTKTEINFTYGEFNDDVYSDDDI